MHLMARLKAGPALGALPVTDELLGGLVAATEGFSGAEIEQVVISACFDAFNERRALSSDDLVHEIGNTVPLSVTQAEQIAELRAWADIRAVAASTPEDRTGYATPEPGAVLPARPGDAVFARGGRPVEA